MKIKALIGAGIIAGSMLVGSAAGAAVTFDAATGTGFVGKGDVQTVLGLNNKQLNEAEKAGLTFTYESVDTTVTEVAWECTNDKNEKVQERERTTTATTEVSGVVSATARDNKKQITGFHMNGFSSKTATSTSTTEGNKLDSCPAESGNWALTTPAGEPTVVSSGSTGGLFVNGVSLPITPPATV